MSWTERELKKRKQAVRHSAASVPSVNAATDHMAALWKKMENANNGLPEELRLAADYNLPAVPAYDAPQFLVWYRAAEGAGLGFTGDAIRYVWPESGQRASNNFWVRWHPERGFRLSRRVFSPVTGPKIVERSFSDKRVDYMIRCLVTGRLITPRAVRKKRLWLF